MMVREKFIAPELKIVKHLSPEIFGTASMDALEYDVRAAPCR
jgi:hypothetical protein